MISKLCFRINAKPKRGRLTYAIDRLESVRYFLKNEKDLDTSRLSYDQFTLDSFTPITSKPARVTVF